MAARPFRHARSSVRATRVAALAGALFAAFLFVSGPASASVDAPEPTTPAAPEAACPVGDVACYLNCILNVVLDDANVLVGPLLGYVLAIVAAVLAVNIAQALATVTSLVAHLVGWVGSQPAYVADLLACLV